MLRACAFIALFAFGVWCWVRGFYAAGKPTAKPTAVTFFAGFTFAAVVCALLVVSLAGCAAGNAKQRPTNAAVTVCSVRNHRIEDCRIIPYPTPKPKTTPKPLPTKAVFGTPFVIEYSEGYVCTAGRNGERMATHNELCTKDSPLRSDSPLQEAEAIRT